MPTDINASTLRRRARLMLIAMALSLPGCATMKPQAEGAPSSFMPDFSDVLPIPPADSDLIGLSHESQEIERRLGVQ